MTSTIYRTQSKLLNEYVKDFSGTVAAKRSWRNISRDGQSEGGGCEVADAIWPLVHSREMEFR